MKHIPLQLELDPDRKLYSISNCLSGSNYLHWVGIRNANCTNCSKFLHATAQIENSFGNITYLFDEQ